MFAFESRAQRRGTHIGDAKPEYDLSGVMACSFERQNQRADLSSFFGTQIRVLDEVSLYAALHLKEIEDSIAPTRLDEVIVDRNKSRKKCTNKDKGQSSLFHSRGARRSSQEYDGRKQCDRQEDQCSFRLIDH